MRERKCFKRAPKSNAGSFFQTRKKRTKQKKLPHTFGYGNIISSSRLETLSAVCLVKQVISDQRLLSGGSLQWWKRKSKIWTFAETITIWLFGKLRDGNPPSQSKLLFRCAQIDVDFFAIVMQLRNDKSFQILSFDVKTLLFRIDGVRFPVLRGAYT